MFLPKRYHFRALRVTLPYYNDFEQTTPRRGSGRMRMKKIYVLDTNVMIQSPLALLSFEDNDIVLPIVCLEELDRLKGDDGERGANARECIRFLEKLRVSGNLLEGAPLPGGGTLRVEASCTGVELPEGLPVQVVRLPELIIMVALEMEQQRHLVRQVMPEMGCLYRLVEL